MAHAVGKGAGAHAVRLLEVAGDAEEAWEVARMLNDPGNDDWRQLRVEAFDAARQVEEAPGEEIGGRRFGRAGHLP